MFVGGLLSGEASGVAGVAEEAVEVLASTLETSSIAAEVELQIPTQ